MHSSPSSAIVTIVLAAFLSQPAAAQTPAAGEADPGVKPTRLIDRDEVRVSRVEIQPGATRRVHAHDDVEYHLWIPIEGNLQLTIGSDAPIAAASGKAFFLKRGTPHGFKNVGATTAAVFEIFVKQTTTAGRPEPLDLVRALALAFAEETSRALER
jgi:quercetin dioxygenase-like cupin family protein